MLWLKKYHNSRVVL